VSARIPAVAEKLASQIIDFLEGGLAARVAGKMPALRNADLRCLNRA